MTDSETPPAYEFTAEVWVFGGKATWYFVTLPYDVADEIEAATDGSSRAFASKRVRVTVGATAWETSIFASKRKASYLLPLKADVRRKEELDEGDVVTVRLEVEARAGT